jgi:hypothetical protein
VDFLFAGESEKPWKWDTIEEGVVPEEATATEHHQTRRSPPIDPIFLISRCCSSLCLTTREKTMKLRLRATPEPTHCIDCMMVRFEGVR